jgi:hypothetical protein
MNKHASEDTVTQPQPQSCAEGLSECKQMYRYGLGRDAMDVSFSSVK